MFRKKLKTKIFFIVLHFLLFLFLNFFAYNLCKNGLFSLKFGQWAWFGVLDPIKKWFFYKIKKMTIFLLFSIFSIVLIIYVYNFQNYYPISMKVVQYMKFHVSVRLQKKKYENMKNLDFKSNYAFFILFLIVFIVYNAYIFIFRNFCPISMKYGLYVYFEVFYRIQSENFQKIQITDFYIVSIVYVYNFRNCCSIWLKLG